MISSFGRQGKKITITLSRKHSLDEIKPINISYILSGRLLLFEVGDGYSINWLNVKGNEKMVVCRKEIELKKPSLSTSHLMIAS